MVGVGLAVAPVRVEDADASVRERPLDEERLQSVAREAVVSGDHERTRARSERRVERGGQTGAVFERDRARDAGVGELADDREALPADELADGGRLRVEAVAVVALVRARHAPVGDRERRIGGRKRVQESWW